MFVTSESLVIAATKRQYFHGPEPYGLGPSPFGLRLCLSVRENFAPCYWSIQISE